MLLCRLSGATSPNGCGNCWNVGVMRLRGPARSAGFKMTTLGPDAAASRLSSDQDTAFANSGLAYSPLQLCIACIAGIWARPWPVLRSVKGLWLSEAMA